MSSPRARRSTTTLRRTRAHELLALGAAHRPERLVVEVVDLLPHDRVARVALPAVAEALGEQLAHGRRHPRGQVHRVGDVA